MSLSSHPSALCRGTHCLTPFLPVSQSQDKQLQEGRVYEQVLIVALKLGEPRKPVSPASRGLHRSGEQPVEELDVLCIGGGGGRVGSAELWREAEITY